MQEMKRMQNLGHIYELPNVIESGVIYGNSNTLEGCSTC